MMNTSTIRLKFYSKFFEQNYLKYFIDTDFFRKQMKAQLVGMQPNFGATHLSRTYISIPPINEQKRIVKKVDQLMELCDILERKIKENQKNSEVLMNTVLKEAFAS